MSSLKIMILNIYKGYIRSHEDAPKTPNADENTLDTDRAWWGKSRVILLPVRNGWRDDTIEGMKSRTSPPPAGDVCQVDWRDAPQSILKQKLNRQDFIKNPYTYCRCTYETIVNFSQTRRHPVPHTLNVSNDFFYVSTTVAQVYSIIVRVYLPWRS